MSGLTIQDIESELSYAYLHAVASRIGANCQIGNRHADNAGVDAMLTSIGTLPGYKTEVDLKVQLKATKQTSIVAEERFHYFLNGKQQYDDLRTEANACPRILVVLFLPPDPDAWLHQTEEALILRRAAYWVSLRGAPATENKSGLTIQIPKRQIFSPENLRQLFERLSRKDIPLYEEVMNA